MDGPYCTDLNIKKLENLRDKIEIRKEKNIYIRYREIPNLFDTSDSISSLTEEEKSFIESITNKYSANSEEELKRSAYITFRDILREEQTEGVKYYNKPLFIH
jgi:hypothetical protein